MRSALSHPSVHVNLCWYIPCKKLVQRKQPGNTGLTVFCFGLSYQTCQLAITLLIVCGFSRDSRMEKGFWAHLPPHFFWRCGCIRMMHTIGQQILFCFNKKTVICNIVFAWICDKEHYVAPTSILALDGTVHMQKGECVVTALRETELGEKVARNATYHKYIRVQNCFCFFVFFSTPYVFQTEGLAATDHLSPNQYQTNENTFLLKWLWKIF